MECLGLPFLALPKDMSDTSAVIERVFYAFRGIRTSWI